MNHITLIGRLTKELTIKGGETKFASFSLAVQRKGKDNTADFINCIAFGRTAELLVNYCTKGQQIAIEGRIQTSSYEKEGQKIFKTDVIIERFHFCGSKAENTTPAFTPIEDDEDLPF